MARKLVWSSEAETQLDEIIAYLESQWTDRELRKFFNRLEEALQTIKINPHTFQESVRKEGTREFHLSPQTTIFYEFNESEVYILLLWPNKSNPEKLD